MDMTYFKADICVLPLFHRNLYFKAEIGVLSLFRRNPTGRPCGIQVNLGSAHCWMNKTMISDKNKYKNN